MNIVRPNILFFFETAAGLGHMRRTSAIVNALAAKGADVTVASGSFQSPDDFFHPDIRLLRLNPLVGKNGSGYYSFDESGAKIPVNDYDQDKWQKARVKGLKEALKKKPFHAIGAEYWPFSRQVSFNKAVDAAIKITEASGIYPLVFSSARDVLHTKNAQGKMGKKELDQERRAIAVIKDKVDLILVHGDPRIVTFDEGFSAIEKIEKKIAYTGFVVNKIDKLPKDQRDRKVIVSVGAGTVGMPILRNIFNAHSMVNELDGYKWVFILGPRMSDAHRESLIRTFVIHNATSPDGKKVEYHNYVDNLPELLGQAEYSISMGGYNTTFEVLASGVKGIIIPKILKSKTDDKFESCPEQAGRALSLQQQGFVSVIEFRDTVDPRKLAVKIGQLFKKSAHSNEVDLFGATHSADILLDRIERRFRNIPIPSFGKDN